MSYFDRVRKANPYHDERGRFSSHDSANSVSIGPAHAKTIERLKAQLGSKEKASKATEYSDYGKLENTSASNKRDELFEKSREEFDKLSDKEKDVIYKYTGNAYKYYNNKIANPISKENRSSEDTTIYKKMGTLDDALSKTTAPENMTVYKAMNIGRLMENGIDSTTTESELQKLVGKEFVDNSYGSTSTSIYTAISFDTYFRVIVKIKVPKGSKGAWVGGVGSGKDRSTFNEEGELLLPRDRAYRISKVSKKLGKFKEDDSHMIELELLNPNHSPEKTK